jgi:hypothetical protein
VSFSAAALAEIYLCNVCSCQEILRRNGRGQADVGSLACFLASDESSCAICVSPAAALCRGVRAPHTSLGVASACVRRYITGQTLRVDGGVGLGL